MAFEPVLPPGSPPPLAPSSAGTKAGSMIYTSGGLPVGADGEAVGAGDVAAGTRYALDVIRSIVEAGGGSMGDIAFNQIFLKDRGDHQAMNAVYDSYLEKGRYPARDCIRADLVKPELLVEIASTAHLG